MKNRNLHLIFMAISVVALVANVYIGRIAPDTSPWLNLLLCFVCFSSLLLSYKAAGSFSEKGLKICTIIFAVVFLIMVIYTIATL